MSDATPLILASSSPRRRELLARLDVSFTVLPADVDETVPDEVPDPAAFAIDLALAKARHVANRHPGATVLGADTIVVLDNRILGKPHDADEARAVLRDLRSRPHQVFTGMAVVASDSRYVDSTETVVHMRDYSDQEIDDYIDSGEPFDKAGSYGIQSARFKSVARYEGCYCNVVGLPLLATWGLLRRAGVESAGDSSLGLLPECWTCSLAKRDDLAGALAQSQHRS